MKAATKAKPAATITYKHAKNQEDFRKIADIITQNVAKLRKPGVLFASPGYQQTKGKLTAKPAVIVTVANKRNVPRQMQLPATLGGYPVDVRQATMLERIRAEDPGRYAQIVALGRPEYTLPHFEGEVNVASGQPTAETLATTAAARPKKPQVDYVPADVPLNAVETEMSIICHASPDAGWPQLKQFFAGIQSTLTVGLYDFTSAHILDELERDLTARGASLKLTLDDPKKNPTADQSDPEAVDSLNTALGSGFKQAWALVNTSPKAPEAMFPNAYHIKVAVADGQRTWLSSGNWNNSNQPDIDPFTDRQAADQVARDSDRDWHVIVNDPVLSGVFEAYLKQDFDSASEAAQTAEPAAVEAAVEFAEAAQLTDAELNAIDAETLVTAKPPSTYFEPKNVPETGTQKIKIQPLLTPDQGVYTAHVLQLIQNAQSKVYMQTQYIHPPDKPEDQKLADLIDALIERQQAGVDVRIIVSQWQLGKWQDRLAQTGIPMDIVRVQHGVHNKGIVVDSQRVMVSSQNWSADGVLRNRDAGVIIDNADAAKYFEQIFVHDWENLATPIAEATGAGGGESEAATAAAAAASPAEGPAVLRGGRSRGNRGRFVMANRKAGRFGDMRLVSRNAVDRTMAMIAPGIDLLADHRPSDPTARRVTVFEADPAEIKAKVRDPNVIVEPEILHWTATIPPAELIRARGLAAEFVPALANMTMSVLVTGGGQPLPNAEVKLFLQEQDDANSGRTGPDGRVRIEFPNGFTPLALVVIPVGGFWTMVKRGPALNETVECPALPDKGPLAWWHAGFGISAFDLNRGQGIKVGVTDTGCGPHPCNAHVVDAGAFINGNTLPAPAGADVDSHGTHVCGIIGARPQAAGQYGGMAPGADLLCARVFPGPESGASQADIANAIDALSRGQQVDVINMSLGANQASEVEHDAIIDAFERGTVCVCAAGNDSGPVNWPAAFAESIAVSAIGTMGWGPPGSLASTRLPVDSSRIGNGGLFLANFSCFGPEVLCAGPGVGIISTVPARFGLEAPYLAMDGTSMASPAVAGLLAALLSASANYRNLPRDRSRAEAAKNILRAACQDIGLALQFQGLGLPQA